MLLEASKLSHEIIFLPVRWDCIIFLLIESSSLAFLNPKKLVNCTNKQAKRPTEYMYIPSFDSGKKIVNCTNKQAKRPTEYMCITSFDFGSQWLTQETSLLVAKMAEFYSLKRSTMAGLVDKGFQVNDTLIFKYEKGSDSVLLVHKDDYFKCN